ncbi:MAG: fibronectin type III domain-containing protein, partial [Phycisphaeraceae bacterium]
DVSDRQTPLTPAPPQATALADTRVRLTWRPQETGGGELLVMRAVEDGPWEQIETLTPDRTTFTDTQAEAGTAYRYRLLARNAHGTSEPGEAVPVRTLEQDHQLHVEDFAPRTDGQLPEANAFGQWHSLPAEGQRFRLHEAEGSPRHAAVREGYVAIGSVPIGVAKFFYTTDLRVDLSSPSAVVGLDVLTQSATRFALALKLADGTWVRGGGAIVNSRQWQPVTFRLDAIADSSHRPARWHQVDITSLKTLEPVEVTADDLRDVRGIGVWVSWLINQRWARFDQLYVEGRDFQARLSEQ